MNNWSQYYDLYNETAFAIVDDPKCKRCGLCDRKRIYLQCSKCERVFCMGCTAYHKHRKYEIIKWK